MLYYVRILFVLLMLFIERHRMDNNTQNYDEVQFTTWTSADEFRLTNRILNVVPIELTYYIVCAIGIPGNIATIVVLMSSDKLRRKPVNVFMSHQAVIDLFACVVTIVEEVMDSYGEQLSKPVLCHVFLSKSGSILFLYTSNYNLLALTVERHFAIVNPLNYDSEKVLRRLPGVFLFIWMITTAGSMYIPTSTVVMYDKCLVAFKVGMKMLCKQ